MASVKPQLIMNNRPGQLKNTSAMPGALEANEQDTERSLEFPKVIVAIPCYNEEVAIGSMVLRSLKYADMVIVIDDGSEDRTVEVAYAAGAQVISHTRNEGKGTGIRDAFMYAKNLGADVLVLLDGDGQHDPDEIPCLIEPLVTEQADLVNGSRFLGNAANNVPKYRRVGQEVLTLATNAGTRRRITDTQSGYRAFSKRTFGCFTFRQNGMAIESEMLMDAADADMKIVEVPINVRYDVEGSTYGPVTHGLSVLNRVVRLVAGRRPLLYYCLPGAVMLVIGMLSLFMMLSIYEATRSMAIEYMVTSILLIILGVMFVSTGLSMFTFRNIIKI